jgi:CBS-domain-containing membrane protein
MSSATWTARQSQLAQLEEEFESAYTTKRTLLSWPVAILMMNRFLEGTANQYMTRAVTMATRQTTMRKLEVLFEKHDFKSLPVVKEGKMLGIVTNFDFLRAFAFTTGQGVPHYDELLGRPVAKVMTEAPLTRVLQLSVSLKSRSFPVIRSERQLMWIISRGGRDTRTWDAGEARYVLSGKSNDGAMAS